MERWQVVRQAAMAWHGFWRVGMRGIDRSYRANCA